MPNIQVLQSPPNVVKVSNQSTPEVRTSYLNPTSFTVLGASDVAVNNPSDGQILTWSANLNKFIVSSAGNTVLAFILANTANDTATLALTEVTQAVALVANASQLAINAGMLAANAGNVFKTTYITSGLTVNTVTNFTTFGNSTVILSANAGSLSLGRFN